MKTRFINNILCLRLMSLLFVFFLSFNNITLKAITTSDLPYMCDFEDEDVNSAWVLNPYIEEINTSNYWTIGTAQAYTGKNSLYVTGTADGSDNTYNADNNVLIAYIDVSLEMGDYDIAYDWMGMGNGNNGYLKIVFASRPNSKNGASCVGNSTEPSWVSSTTSISLMGSETRLNNNDRWTHVQTSITIPKSQENKTTTRIFFVWVNSDAKPSATTPFYSVAIDNFQLGKVSTTDYPHDIHVSTNLGSSTISWEGNADGYEILYRKKTESDFKSTTVDNPSLILNDVEYGAYEFWICSINGDEKTIYSVFPTIYIYPTDCFDALNMYNASFEYGTWSRTGNNLNVVTKGNDRIDYGTYDSKSRHTTHFDQTEIDPRTIAAWQTFPGLRTVPNGEYGSVRLGNWNINSEWERISFKYTVDSRANAILIVHYAMVLQNPNHDDIDQPRFTLDILTEDGQSIDTKCASVDFHSPTESEKLQPEVRDLWHVTGDVYWQDWRTIGVSVEDYVGQTLTVVLTTYDCDQGGHFGYAYFMLNCSRSDVDGLPWGDDSSTQMFTAPNGFDYAWFNKTDEQLRDTLSTEREFIPSTIDGLKELLSVPDTNTYLCHATYPSNPECGFWFEASAKAHNPIAELDWKWTPRDCQNGFTLYNRCHISLTNQITGVVDHRYDKQLEQCYLLTEDDPLNGMLIGYPEDGFYFPVGDEGGTFRYGVRTGIMAKDQLFADTVWYTIDIPAISPVVIDSAMAVCRGTEVEFPLNSHIKLTESGVYYDSLKSVVTGCDSTIVLNLIVNEPLMVDLYDTICNGGEYAFNGKIVSGTRREVFITESRVTGCDSLVTLHLTEAPIPIASMLESLVCADEPLLLNIEHSRFLDSLLIQFETGEQAVAHYPNDQQWVSLPDGNIPAGEHKVMVMLYTPWCEPYMDSLTFNVRLASSVIEARYDDVLVFLNSDYNGGYNFVSYQWYADGQLIEGATGDYFYLPGMSHDVEYTVRVTLDTGEELWVCPFSYASRNQAQADPLLSEQQSIQPCKIIRNGQLVILVNGREYNAVGGVIK